MRETGRRITVRLALMAVALGVMGLAGCGAPKTAEMPKVPSFWPPFPSKPRVQFLVSYEFSEDVAKPKSGLDALIFGKELTPAMLINKPYGVKAWDSKIYVCDTHDLNVAVIDIKNREVRLIGTSGTGKLSKPVDIAISPDGMKYVADAVRGLIFVYDAKDRHIASLGHPNLKPVGVAVHENLLYISDLAANHVEVMDRLTGQTLRTIGATGREAGQLTGPLGIDTDAQGNVYVTDLLNCRVEKFDPEGKFVMAIGSLGDAPGTFTRPKQLAVDREGIIYVVDAAFQNVQMFDKEGRLLMDFGGTGTHPGNMDLPAGICVHEGDLDLFKQYVHPAFEAERLVIVTNQFGKNKVAVYAFGHEREGMSVGQGAIVAPPPVPSVKPTAPEPPPPVGATLPDAIGDK